MVAQSDALQLSQLPSDDDGLIESNAAAAKPIDCGHKSHALCVCMAYGIR